MQPLLLKVDLPVNRAILSNPGFIDAIQTAGSERINKVFDYILQHFTITRIGYESGFQNLSNFNRQFKKIKGMTPRSYMITGS